jgi:hypothetical protein
MDALQGTDDEVDEKHPRCLAFLSKCCGDNSGGGKDPHFMTWHGTKFDFHGECDLVFLENPFFRDGLGISIHMRTKLRRQWSYVKTLTVRIGSDTLEVQGGADETYWINGIPYNGTPSASLSGYAVAYKHVHEHQRKFVVHLDNNQKIEVTTYKDLVSFNIRGATHAHFGKSIGLTGEYGTGRMLARDGVSVVEDPVLFGQEWQVHPEDPQLFRVVEGPQFPVEGCKLPSTFEVAERRRRLGESGTKTNLAAAACSKMMHKLEEFDACVYDVLLMDDVGVASAYD